MSRRAAYVRIGYVVALAAALLIAALFLFAAWSSGALGFDYKAYDLAVDHLFAGQTMYYPNVQETGSFGLFFYPPPFALFVIPFAVLPVDVGVVAWTGFLVFVSVLAVAAMPVAARVRWAVLLLAALSWPLVYAIKLGQVGPIILLTFALGWRWLDRPWRLGLSVAVGTVVKIQPALLIGWAMVTGRRRAAIVAVIAVAVIAAVATVVAGPASWFQEADLLGRVSKPILTPHAFGIGRLLYEAGVPEGVALAVHVANLALVALVAAFAVWRASAAGSYLAVVVASQFLSPVLWDHYALILLLPVAWLLARGRWWAAVIPLATATPLLLLPIPGTGWIYPVVFWAALLAVTWEGVRDSAGSGSTRPNGFR
ncbi:MAG TPA: glycosyltransferase family 87 protein [Candidatus Dormibacteraeota bacterium]|nr:glycosyltransferase family 87 protein [Candidatus Dormibacteraeota bacterium]